MPQCFSCQRELPASVTACPYCGSKRSPFTDALLDQVMVLLGEDRKLEAVKLVKETLDLSLLEAKTAVDRLAAEIAVPTLDLPTEPLPTEPATGKQAWQAEAKELLQQGKKLHAIKLCREQAGCSLKEAKEQVDALELRLGKKSSSGCFGVLLVAAMIGGAFAIGALSISW